MHFFVLFSLKMTWKYTYRDHMTYGWFLFLCLEVILGLLYYNWIWWKSAIFCWKQSNKKVAWQSIIWKEIFIVVSLLNAVSLFLWWHHSSFEVSPNCVESSEEVVPHDDASSFTTSTGRVTAARSIFQWLSDNRRIKSNVVPCSGLIWNFEESKHNRLENRP